MRITCFAGTRFMARATGLAPLFLLIGFLAPPGVAATRVDAHVPLPNDAFVVTHASRYYHTSPDTMASTTSLLERAAREGHSIMELGQEDIYRDPDWYALHDERVTQAFLSVSGEHPLYPTAAEGTTFRVTALGGYHCACLGWTVSELAGRFLGHTGATQLEVRLPMAAIYTGFLFDGQGRLKPATPYWESIADDSIDGLNLWQVTHAMPDDDWASFMMESLRIGIIEKAPLSHSRHLHDVEFRLMRDDKALKTFYLDGRTRPMTATRTVIFRYLSPEG